MTEIVLTGCTPTPLASYLKALGVLRLLSKADSEARAAWWDEHLVLHTTLDRTALERFFLHDYQPTPIMAPWNAGSGFYFQERKSKEKDPTTGKKIKLGLRDQPTTATKIVDAVINSTSKRLHSYRVALQLCRNVIRKFGFQEAPDRGTNKDRLILSLRAHLSDNCLEWIDAALVVSSEGTQFPPLLGTGGNDGNMDFTSNFMQRLIGVIGVSDTIIAPHSSDRLRMSLFGEPAPYLEQKNKIGQFDPSQVGGVNATTGFKAESAINPWDYVLMIEGALSFAATAVRRNAEDGGGTASYPFTVYAVDAGFGSLGEGDATIGRGELWMPLWRHNATYAEVHALFAEGRVALGRKPAKDALDFVRAVRRLGGYRGIESFHRYGLLKRNGDAHFATPLERINVTANPETQWLDDLDQHKWLTRFRRFAQGETVAKRFLTLRRRLEDALFELSGHAPSPGEVQSLLVLLGEIQSALAVSKKAMESLPPLPRLSERWVQQAAADSTPAFRIARALAGLRGVKDVPLPLRAQLFPMHPRYNQWIEQARNAKGASNDPASRVRIHTSIKGTLPDTLSALLTRRLWLAEQFEMKDKPLHSAAGVDAGDITAFLHDAGMDSRIAALLPGLCLCAIPKDTEHGAGEGEMPAAFALLKLCLIPDATLRDLGRLHEKDKLPVPPGMLAQLAAGNSDNRAVRLAWRRLRASALGPVFTPDALPELDGIAPRRAAGALLIPLRFGASGALVRSVLKAPVTEPEPA